MRGDRKMIESIPEALRADIGVIRRVKRPRQGHASETAIVETASGQYVIKRAQGDDFCLWLEREAIVLAALSSASLPVPALYRFYKDAERNESWALLEYIEGDTLRHALMHEADERTRQQLIFSFGEALAAVHATPCPQTLIRTKPWLEEMLEKAADRLKRGCTDGTAELLNKLKQHRPAPGPTTFIHGDFTIDNVLVHRKTVTGIIDWSGGAYGDPRYDLALAIRPKRNAFERENDIAVFFAGYGQPPINRDDYEYFANGLYEFF
jgi:aminoglycoside phosphotransferase (APT) family kinase protein